MAIDIRAWWNEQNILIDALLYKAIYGSEESGARGRRSLLGVQPEYRTVRAFLADHDPTDVFDALEVIEMSVETVMVLVAAKQHQVKELSAEVPGSRFEEEKLLQLRSAEKVLEALKSFHDALRSYNRMNVLGNAHQ